MKISRVIKFLIFAEFLFRKLFSLSWRHCKPHFPKQHVISVPRLHVPKPKHLEYNDDWQMKQEN